MPFQKASPSRLPARSVLLAAHSRQRSPPATRTPRRTQNLLAGCIFVGGADKSAFALLSQKVTKACVTFAESNKGLRLSAQKGEETIYAKNDKRNGRERLGQS